MRKCMQPVSMAEAGCSRSACRSLLFCMAHTERVDVWVQLRGVGCVVDSLLRCITLLQV